MAVGGLGADGLGCAVAREGTEAMASAEGSTVMEALPEGEVLREAEAQAEALAEALGRAAVAEGLAAPLAEGKGVPEPHALADALSERECVVDWQAEGEGVAEAHGVAEAQGEPAALPDTDAEGERLGVREALPVPHAVALPQAVGDVLIVPVPVPEYEGVCEAQPEAVREAVPQAVAEGLLEEQAEAETLGLGEAEPVPDCVEEGHWLGAAELLAMLGVPAGEPEAAPLALVLCVGVALRLLVGVGRQSQDGEPVGLSWHDAVAVAVAVAEAVSDCPGQRGKCSSSSRPASSSGLRPGGCGSSGMRPRGCAAMLD